MKRQIYFLIGLLSVSSTGFLKAADKAPAASLETKIDGKPIKLNKYAKSYIGQGNVTVDVASYKTEDGNDEAILWIKGVEGEWDGKALRHTRTADKEDYVTTRNGQDWYTLIRLSSRHPLLFVPESDFRDGLKLAESDGASQSISPLEIFREYERQQASK